MRYVKLEEIESHRFDLTMVPASIYHEVSPERMHAVAAKRMAIVDALRQIDREIVHHIGLRKFMLGIRIKKSDFKPVLRTTQKNARISALGARRAAALGMKLEVPTVCQALSLEDLGL